MTNNTKHIPTSNPLPQHQQLQAELEQAVLEVMRSGHYILGTQVKAFEQEAADYLGVKQTVSCASGSDALLLSLAALGIQPDDEVITSDFSFISAAETACYLGAVPVLVDIEPDSFNLSPERVSEYITDKTRAIIAVHLYGQTANMEALTKIADQYGIPILEDCAQAFGARRGERHAGALSKAGCHSFYPTKNLSAYGDGGLISVTDDDDFAKSLRVLRNHGATTRYHHHIIGYNSRLDEIQAAVLRVKLKYLDEWNRQRVAIATHYDTLLKDFVEIPTRDTGGTHVFHQYTIISEQRDQIAQALHNNGISASIYYPTRLSQQPALNKKCRTTACPNATKIAQRCLSLPIYPGLESATIERVAEIIINTLTAKDNERN